MRQLDKETLARFRNAFDPTADVLSVVAETIGGTTAAKGLWRFFGRSVPAPGIQEWNSPALWKSHWGELARGLACIGEDIFGNQLVCINETPDLLIWDHESGALFTLQLTPQDALEAVLAHGIEWIDFYENGSPKVGLERLADVAENSHVHWTTPLVLGGAVDVSNTSIVERTNHLVGHGKLWQKVQGLPPGSPVVIKPN